MKKRILITGSTDGIGLATAYKLQSQGCEVILHGRSRGKLQSAQAELGRSETADKPSGYLADLSSLSDVKRLAASIIADHGKLDVLINNAGVLNTPDAITEQGLDVRFVVNTLAPWVLIHELLGSFSRQARVINLASAAQRPVDLQILKGAKPAADAFDAYAQSKLALILLTQALARRYPEEPVFIAINPGSMLGSKMVKEGFGVEGKDLSIGADILARAALSDDFAEASGKYYDNDSGRFAAPHAEAADANKSADVVRTIAALTGIGET